MQRVSSILVVDDEPLFAEALTTIINSEEDLAVIGAASNGLEALQQLERLHSTHPNTIPDVVLTDIQMPKLNGIELIKAIKEKYPTITILILTTFNEEEYIIEGLAHGASGYLLKGGDFKKIAQTIRNALHGHSVLPLEVTAKLSHFLLQNKRQSTDVVSTLPVRIVQDERFTAREKEILLHLKSRLSIKEMAKVLHISEGTVKNYLTAIYQKLQVKNRAEAIDQLNKEGAK
ncbi:MAG: response regulator transcription factor [Bacillaceae bacterium]|nr:response regulator transcription factor [Bacillaceae bacterium]